MLDEINARIAILPHILPAFPMGPRLVTIGLLYSAFIEFLNCIPGFIIATEWKNVTGEFAPFQQVRFELAWHVSCSYHQSGWDDEEIDHCFVSPDDDESCFW
jgi:hypothetical protein